MKSIRSKRMPATRSMTVIRLYAVGTAELGNESETAMLKHIRSVNAALRTESLYRWMRSIISFPYLKEERTTEII